MAPMQSKLRQAIGLVKDQTSISLAKVTNNGFADLDVVLVKATSHDEIPIDEKYVQEIIHLTTGSTHTVAACIVGLGKRLAKTHDWIVALKCLMLISLLLRQGDESFEEELMLAHRRGVPLLNLSDFRDEAHSNSWDFSAFVRAYASFLAERIECYANNGRRSDTRKHATSGNEGYGSDNERRRGGKQGMPLNEMSTEMLLDRLLQLQRLLGHVFACRPVGAAKNNRLVQIALYPVVRESFELYSEICNGITILLDGFFEMEQQDCLKGLEIYSRSARQVDELASFYEHCRQSGVGSSHEYPSVQKIPQEHLDTLDEFVRNRSAVSSRTSKFDVSSPVAPGSRFASHQPPSSKEPEPEYGDTAAHERSVQRGKTQTFRENFDKKPEFLSAIHLEEKKAPPCSSVSPGKKSIPSTVPSTEASTSVTSARKDATISNSIQQESVDLLNLEKATISAEEHEEKLALALFAPGSGTTITTSKWETFSSAGEDSNDVPGSSENGSSAIMSDAGKTGWELALVSSSSKFVSSTNTSMAGGFDRLLLDSMYNQGEVRQKVTSSTPAGSASSVALPGKPASSFLALPAPMATMEEDPFAASVCIPPPAYVQMADMKQKQAFLLQEQQVWQQYQKEGMQGYYSLSTLLNNPSTNAPKHPAGVYPMPYYHNMGAIPSYGQFYAAHY